MRLIVEAKTLFAAPGFLIDAGSRSEVSSRATGVPPNHGYFIGCSFINHPFGVPLFYITINIHIYIYGVNYNDLTATSLEL